MFLLFYFCFDFCLFSSPQRQKLVVYIYYNYILYSIVIVNKSHKQPETNNELLLFTVMSMNAELTLVYSSAPYSSIFVQNYRSASHRAAQGDMFLVLELQRLTMTITLYLTLFGGNILHRQKS